MESFSRDKRLLTKQEYERVFKKSKKIDTPAFFVLVALNDQGKARLGFALSKKSLPKATMRNRARRVIRESFRKQCMALKPVDIVVLARPDLKKLSNQEIRSHLEILWQRVNTAAY